LGAAVIFTIWPLLGAIIYIESNLLHFVLHTPLLIIDWNIVAHDMCKCDVSTSAVTIDHDHIDVELMRCVKKNLTGVAPVCRTHICFLKKRFGNRLRLE
jgi:hypothetical protein